jgi:hypothetical protein
MPGLLFSNAIVWFIISHLVVINMLVDNSGRVPIPGKNPIRKKINETILHDLDGIYFTAVEMGVTWLLLYRYARFQRMTSDTDNV